MFVDFGRFIFFALTCWLAQPCCRRGLGIPRLHLFLLALPCFQVVRSSHSRSRVDVMSRPRPRRGAPDAPSPLVGTLARVSIRPRPEALSGPRVHGSPGRGSHATGGSSSRRPSGVTPAGVARGDVEPPPEGLGVAARDEYTRYLGRSRADEALVARLFHEGKISAISMIELPGKDTRGRPGKGRVVAFAAQFDAGLCFPSTSLLRRVLRFFGLEVAHLAPGAFVRLAIFEWAVRSWGFSGSAELFAYYHVPRVARGVVPGAKGEADLVSPFGAVSFGKRPGRKSSQYPPWATKNKWEDWRKDWFYCSVTDPAFTNEGAGPRPHMGGPPLPLGPVDASRALLLARMASRMCARDLAEEYLMLRVLPLARDWSPFLLPEGDGPFLDMRCLRAAPSSDPSAPGYLRAEGESLVTPLPLVASWPAQIPPWCNLFSNGAGLTLEEGEAAAVAILGPVMPWESTGVAAVIRTERRNRACAAFCLSLPERALVLTKAELRLGKRPLVPDVDERGRTTRSRVEATPSSHERRSASPRPGLGKGLAHAPTESGSDSDTNYLDDDATEELPEFLEGSLSGGFAYSDEASRDAGALAGELGALESTGMSADYTTPPPCPPSPRPTTEPGFEPCALEVPTTWPPESLVVPPAETGFFCRAARLAMSPDWPLEPDGRSLASLRAASQTFLLKVTAAASLGLPTLSLVVLTDVIRAGPIHAGAPGHGA